MQLNRVENRVDLELILKAQALPQNQRQPGQVQRMKMLRRNPRNSCSRILLLWSTDLLASMTGHGQALVQSPAVRVLVEVRSVNNRFLKTHIHCDLDVNRQAQLEVLLKQHLSRGSVNLKIKSEHLQQQEHYRINEAVVRAYWLQLSEIAGNSQRVNIESILPLPGVVRENIADDDAELWPVVEQAVTEALHKLSEMRIR